MAEASAAAVLVQIVAHVGTVAVRSVRKQRAGSEIAVAGGRLILRGSPWLENGSVETLSRPLLGIGAKTRGDTRPSSLP